MNFFVISYSNFSIIINLIEIWIDPIQEKDIYFEWLRFLIGGAMGHLVEPTSHKFLMSLSLSMRGSKLLKRWKKKTAHIRAQHLQVFCANRWKEAQPLRLLMIFSWIRLQKYWFDHDHYALSTGRYLEPWAHLRLISIRMEFFIFDALIHNCESDLSFWRLELRHTQSHSHVPYHVSYTAQGKSDFVSRNKNSLQKTKK